MAVSRRYLLLLAGYVSLLLFIAASADLDVRLWVFDVADAIPFGDKLGHMFLAGLLSFLVNSTLRCRTCSLVGLKLRIGSLATFVLVLTEELSQIWIASRSVDPWDLLCDVIGIYLAGVLAAWNQKLATERQSV
jgi:polysaccharide biosynthesis protein VpsQ